MIKKHFTIILVLLLSIGVTAQSISHYYLSLKVDMLQNKIAILEINALMVVDSVVDEIFIRLSQMLTPPTGIQKMEHDLNM